jgi:hypothetical protein
LHTRAVHTPFLARTHPRLTAATLGIAVGLFN